MTRRTIYGDESGDLVFEDSAKASKYFILTTALVNDHSIETALLDLRRELTWDGVEIKQDFHAVYDAPAVKQRVFDLIATYDFRVDATLLEKRKAQPQLRITPMRFYQYAWYYHLRYVAPLIAKPSDELLVVAASIGTKKQRKAFYTGVQDVADQVTPTPKFRTACWPAAIDPCLQVADYCGWAIQRKWENGDTKWFDLIKSNVKSQFNIFAYGTTLYY